MKIEADCPYCQKTANHDEDIIYAERDDILRSLIECDCGKAFVIAITMSVDISVHRVE